MPDYQVISDISELLRQRLDTGLQNIVGFGGNVLVSNLTGAPPAPPTVTIFLYEVLEDPSTRNRPALRRPNANGYDVQKPDLTLLLRYLITPWLNDLVAPYTDQVILGRIAQIMYENTILSFNPSADGERTEETIRVTMAPISLEDRTRIWNSLQQKYRVSLTYEVRVANIAATQSRTVRSVESRDLNFAGPLGVPS